MKREKITPKLVKTVWKKLATAYNKPNESDETENSTMVFSWG